MEHQFTYNPLPKPTRPTLLLVLCILSFVMVLVGLVYYGFMSVTTFISSSALSNTYQYPGMEGMTQGLEDMIFWNKINVLTAFICEFVSLTGVLLMFNLKKAGFAVYVVAEIVPCVTALISAYQVAPLFSGLGGGLGLSSLVGGISFIWVFVMIFFDIGFIILYALNFKHMK